MPTFNNVGVFGELHQILAEDSRVILGLRGRQLAGNGLSRDDNARYDQRGEPHRQPDPP